MEPSSYQHREGATPETELLAGKTLLKPEFDSHYLPCGGSEPKRSELSQFLKPRTAGPLLQYLKNQVLL